MMARSMTCAWHHARPYIIGQILRPFSVVILSPFVNANNTRTHTHTPFARDTIDMQTNGDCRRNSEHDSLLRIWWIGGKEAWLSADIHDVRTVPE